MMDIGWSELFVIAIVALIAIGPRELPRVMRTVAHWVRRAQDLGREFQSSLEEMGRDEDIAEAKRALEKASSLSPNRILQDTMDPDGTVSRALNDPSLQASGAITLDEAKPADPAVDANSATAAVSPEAAPQVAPLPPAEPTPPEPQLEPMPLAAGEAARPGP